MASKKSKKVIKMSSKKKTKKSIKSKVKKKSIKSKVKKKYIHPENRSGDPKFNVLIGKTFYWEEPWSEWTAEELQCIDECLLDKDGNPPDELCGDWRITSVDSDGETVWLSFVPTDGDQQMEFPISLIPNSAWED